MTAETAPVDPFASVRPASSVLTDVELRAQLERVMRTEGRTLATERTTLAGAASITYAAEWNVRGAVVAEAKIRIASLALDAPPARMRSALAYAIGQELRASISSTDPFTNAVGGARRTAGKQLLRSLYEELDPAEVVQHMV